jgi:acyl-CoA thioester hydrolase
MTPSTPAPADADGDAGLIETHRGTIYPWHCDHMGHMNVMWYVGRFDEATWQLLGSVGMTAEWLRARGRGMVAVDQRIAYQRELLAGQTIVVRSAVLEVRDKSIRFAHRMIETTSGEVCAVTQLTGVHIDTTTRKSCALPADLRERAARAVTPMALPWDA